MNLPIPTSKRTRYFVAVIEAETDRAFGIWFPDVPGCYGAADDFEDVIPNAATALRQHVEVLQAAGKPTPTPRPYAEVMTSEEVKGSIASGCVVIVVPLLADGGRAVRVNISLERGLVEMIDAVADARGLTRSSFLAQAAREKIMTGVA